MSLSSQSHATTFRFRPQYWPSDDRCLQLRNPWRRLLAKGVDFLLVGLLTGIVLLVSQMSGLSLSLGYALLCQAAGLIVYDTLFTSLWSSTPGKYLFGLAVQNQGHRPLDWESALLRATWVNGLLLLSGLIPLLPLVFLVYQKQRLCRSGFTSWDAPQQILVYRLGGID